MRLLIAVSAFGLFFAPPSMAADELTALSLEDLADATISSTIALGIHHTHPEGEFMLGYGFMRMGMAGNRQGRTELEVADVLGQGYMVAPTRMGMEMHMLELMYGVSENVSLMAMLPYKSFSMDHVTASGMGFRTESAGFGDASLTALYSFFWKYPHRLHLTTGIGLPTGSIDKRDATPMGPNQKLPYPMQLGSGTYDPILGLTYLGAFGPWSWGAHGVVRFSLGENSESYALGARYRADTWLSRRWTDRFSSFLGFEANLNSDIHGADAELNPAMVPTADPGLRGARQVFLRLGSSAYVPNGVLEGSRVSIGVSVPVYESLDGPQLETDWRISVSFQWVY